MDRYKKKSLNFCKDVENRELRAYRRSIDRRNSKHIRLSVLRQIENTSLDLSIQSSETSTLQPNENRKTQADKNNNKEPQNGPLPSKLPSRASMLKKWKEEKELKKKLELKKQMPCFKVPCSSSKVGSTFVPPPKSLNNKLDKENSRNLCSVSSVNSTLNLKSRILPPRTNNKQNVTKRELLKPSFTNVASKFESKSNVKPSQLNNTRSKIASFGQAPLKKPATIPKFTPSIQKPAVQKPKAVGKINFSFIASKDSSKSKAQESKEVKTKDETTKERKSFAPADFQFKAPVGFLHLNFPNGGPSAILARMRANRLKSVTKSPVKSHLPIKNGTPKSDINSERNDGISAGMQTKNNLQHSTKSSPSMSLSSKEMKNFTPLSKISKLRTPTTTNARSDLKYSVLNSSVSNEIKNVTPALKISQLRVPLRKREQPNFNNSVLSSSDVKGFTPTSRVYKLRTPLRNEKQNDANSHRVASCEVKNVAPASKISNLKTPVKKIEQLNNTFCSLTSNEVMSCTPLSRITRKSCQGTPIKLDADSELQCIVSSTPSFVKTNICEKSSENSSVRPENKNFDLDDISSNNNAKKSEVKLCTPSSRITRSSMHKSYQGTPIQSAVESRSRCSVSSTPNSISANGQKTSSGETCIVSLEHKDINLNKDARSFKDEINKNEVKICTPSRVTRSSTNKSYQGTPIKSMADSKSQHGMASTPDSTNMDTRKTLLRSAYAVSSELKNIDLNKDIVPSNNDANKLISAIEQSAFKDVKSVFILDEEDNLTTTTEYINKAADKCVTEQNLEYDVPKCINQSPEKHVSKSNAESPIIPLEYLLHNKETVEYEPELMKSDREQATSVLDTGVPAKGHSMVIEDSEVKENVPSLSSSLQKQATSVLDADVPAKGLSMIIEDSEVEENMPSLSSSLKTLSVNEECSNTGKVELNVDDFDIDEDLMFAIPRRSRRLASVHKISNPFSPVDSEFSLTPNNSFTSGLAAFLNDSPCTSLTKNLSAVSIDSPFSNKENTFSKPVIQSRPSDSLNPQIKQLRGLLSPIQDVDIDGNYVEKRQTRLQRKISLLGTPERPLSRQQRKLSLLGSPRKTFCSPRKSIKGDLISFSPM